MGRIRDIGAAFAAMLLLACLAAVPAAPAMSKTAPISHPLAEPGVSAIVGDSASGFATNGRNSGGNVSMRGAGDSAAALAMSNDAALNVDNPFGT